MIKRTLSLLIMGVLARLPATRCYGFKSRLLKAAGVSAHPSCRVVSSAQILGTIKVAIGEDTYVGHDVMIIGAGAKVSIGNHVDIGPRALLTTGSHEIDMIGAH